MINRLLQIIQRPEKGWDPIPQTYAAQFAAAAYAATIDERAFRPLVERFSSGRRPRMLDLGSGPGHNAVYFAQQGCAVTCHDISSHYLTIAENNFRERGLSARFTLGYLEEARGTYDIVLVSQCWYYCIADSAFAEKLISLLNDNGIAFATINNEVFFRKENVRFPFVKRSLRLFQFLLNNVLNIKIGHPFPTHNKIKRIFSRLQRRHRLRLCTVERSDYYTLLTVIR